LQFLSQNQDYTGEVGSSTLSLSYVLPTGYLCRLTQVLLRSLAGGTVFWRTSSIVLDTQTPTGAYSLIYTLHAEGDPNTNGPAVFSINRDVDLWFDTRLIRRIRMSSVFSAISGGNYLQTSIAGYLIPAGNSALATFRVQVPSL
jgi:hypothetical protein